MHELAYELNYAGAALARKACDEFSTPEKPRYVAGAIGPTTRTASISPDVNDPGARNVSYDQLVAAYLEAANGLVDGGADLLIIETIFDSLNAKAAVFAVETLFEDRGRRWPVIISGTITDASGRTLSGQVTEAFWNAIRHAKPIAVGLNCALGAPEMRPYIAEMARIADTYVSCYPNAGLPNAFGEYDESPERQAGYIADFAVEGKMPKALKLKLKYQGKKSVIEGLRRVSTPGLRRYVGATDIPRVRGGMGVAMVSTSEGVMTDTQARKKNIGGELLCYVW